MYIYHLLENNNIEHCDLFNDLVIYKFVKTIQKRESKQKSIEK